jgi:DNA-binding transcriptional LysR family regulator
MVHADVSLSDRPLDLHRIKQFQCVASHLGFTRAAEELHLSQQALSSTVQQLEKQVGATLFNRSGRKVSLTPAGIVLSNGAAAILAAADALARQTHEAGKGASRPFVLGHTPAITAEEVFDLIESVQRRAPEASFTARQIFPDQLAPSLYDGTIDVALRRGVATPHDLAAAVIAYHPVRIAVAHDHRLAAHTIVTLADLRYEKIAVWAPPGASYYTDFILSTCRRAGFEPEFVVNPIQGTPPVTAAVNGRCVAFVTEHVGPALGGRVIVLDLEDAPLAPTQALWLSHTVSPIRDLLMAVENR